MLPSIVQVIVVWHPADDTIGLRRAWEFRRHFQGAPFKGLHDGAVEVYVRCAGWSDPHGAPLPIELPGENERSPEFTAIVPLLGRGMAGAVESGHGPWHEYLAGIARAHGQSGHRVGVFPLLLDDVATVRTELGRMFNHIHRIGTDAEFHPEPEVERCRDLTQALVRLTGDPPGQRLKVFISYTNHAGPGEQGDIRDLVRDVKAVIREMRLNYFVDTEDLQAGDHWADDLQQYSQTGAFLALRTDLYPASTWCQLEMRSAKYAGVPIVIMDALGASEERGSFLMDNVPRVPVRMTDGRWDLGDIRRCLNLLVNECLKHSLWRRQRRLVEQENPDLAIDWWSPHAPEPTTLVHVLSRAAPKTPLPGTPFRIVHPGPDLQRPEQEVLELTAGGRPLEFLTPSSLLSRGGLAADPGRLLPGDSLRGVNLGLSLSDSPDLRRLGLLEDDFKAALAELTRAVLRARGNLIYGGSLRPEGYLTFVATQTEQSRHLERPFRIYLAWPEHRGISLAELRSLVRELDRFATLVCLDRDGDEVPYDHDRGEDPEKVDPASRPAAMTALRLHMRARESARVFLGGRRIGFLGKTAGLVEEAHLALSAGQPVFLAAGFGGVTADIAQALGFDTGRLALDPDDREREPRLREGLEMLADLTRQPGWSGLGNGLTEEENLELLESHRPPDIGALVCLGLGRLGRAPTIDPWAYPAVV